MTKHFYLINAIKSFFLIIELIEEPDEPNDTVDENDDRFLDRDESERQKEEVFIPNLLEDEEEEITVSK